MKRNHMNPAPLGSPGNPIRGYQDRPSGTVHELIAETAKAMAHEVYDTLMSSHNFWYSGWKAKHPGMAPKMLETIFVRQRWGRFIPAARATLARMLQSHSLDSTLRDRIEKALVLDRTLIRSRVGGLGAQVTPRSN